MCIRDSLTPTAVTGCARPCCSRWWRWRSWRWRRRYLLDEEPLAATPPVREDLQEGVSLARVSASFAQAVPLVWVKLQVHPFPESSAALHWLVGRKLLAHHRLQHDGDGAGRGQCQIWHHDVQRIPHRWKHCWRRRCRSSAPRLQETALPLLWRWLWLWYWRRHWLWLCHWHRRWHWQWRDWKRRVASHPGT